MNPAFQMHWIKGSLQRLLLLPKALTHPEGQKVPYENRKEWYKEICYKFRLEQTNFLPKLLSCVILQCFVFFSSEQYSAFVFLSIMTAYILGFTAVWVYKTSALHIRNRMIPVADLILLSYWYMEIDALLSTSAFSGILR